MSLKLKVTDTNQQRFTGRLVDLGEHLTVTVVEPFCYRHGVHWDRRFKEFFSPSGQSDPLEATGELDFHLPAYFAAQMSELENGIRAALKALGIRTGEFRYNYYPNRNVVETIRIPILENPTAVDVPPEVSMTPAAAWVLLRDLLGYPQVDGRLELLVDDVLKRVTSVTEEKIQKCGSAPMSDRETGRGRGLPSQATMRRVRRGLDELTCFVRWVASHNYKTVEVS